MSKMWERAELWPADRASGAPTDDEYARGVAEGRRTVEAEVASERDVLLQLAVSLEALQSPSVALIASLTVASVERLVLDIAGTVPIDGALLRERADALAAIVSDQSDVVLAVHPDDAHFFDATMPTIGDRTLSRGTVEARTATSVHEDGVVPALQRMHAEISRLGLTT